MRKLLNLGLIKVFLCMVMMCMVIPLSGTKIQAAYKKSGDYTYSVDSKGVTIQRYRGNSKKVTIPEKIAGKKVVQIGDEAFIDNKKIQKVIIPKTVVSMENHVFAGCTKLKTVVLSENISEIPASAFLGCESLKKINLEAIDVIMDYAFSGCKSLSGVLNFEAITSIRQMAFEGCEQIKEVHFSEMLQELGSNYYHMYSINFIPGMGSSNPFDGCTNLARFVVAEGNENFKTVDGVIYGKTEKWIVAVPSARQGDFTIGENIVGIGSYAFGGSQLSKIILAKETKIFAEGAFARSQISDFSFRSDYLAEEYYYDRKLFEGCSKLQKFVFPENMIYNVSIDLSGCTSLKEIILPKGLIETNEFAQGCSKLEKVQLPETLLELPDNCFSDCTMLSQINLDKIEKIGSNTFLNCKGLKGELNLESTNTIRARAFAGCTGITSVTLSDKISSIGHSSMRLKDLKMNTNMVANPFPGCTSLEKITIPDGTPYQVIDNVLYSGNLEVLICVPASRNGKYIVKYGVKRIAHFAFEGAAVSEIVLSNSVYEVASLAIFRCDVQSITIPKDVYCLQTTEKYALFESCNKLSEINVKAGNFDYVSEDGVIYTKNTSTKRLLYYPSAKKGKTYTLPKGYQIYETAFKGAKNLRKVYLNSGVKKFVPIYEGKENIKMYVKKNSSIAKVFEKKKVSYNFY